MPVEAAWKRLIRHSAPLFMVSVVINILTLASPLYMVQLYDRVLSSRYTETLVFLTLITAAALLVYGVLEALRSAMLNRAADWFHSVTVPHVIDNASYVERLGVPRVSLGLRDVDTIKSFIASSSKTLLDLPFTPLFVFVAFLIHPWIGLLTVFAAVTIGGMAIANHRLSRAGAQQHAQAATEAENTVVRSLQHSDVMHAMSMKDALLLRWVGLYNVSRGVSLKALDIAAFFYGSSRFLRMLFQALVLGLGAYLVIIDEMSVGLIIAGSIVLGKALGPVDQFLTVWRTFSQTKLALNRLNALDLEVAPEKNESGAQIYATATPLEVAAETLRYTATNGTAILTDVSFTAYGGEVMAIVGPSGAGKTTLLKVIARIHSPTGGQLKYRGAPIESWSRKAYGAQLGYLPQRTGLFPGTLAQNISRFKEDVSEDHLMDAVEAAGLSDIVDALPQGLETIIDVDGGFFSGGQVQRIGLARALFGRPPVLILDEPDASLDDAGKAKLAQALETAKSWGCCIILSTHSLDLLSQCDTALILVQGNARAFAPARDILETLRAKTQPSQLEQSTPQPQEQPNV